MMWSRALRPPRHPDQRCRLQQDHSVPRSRCADDRGMVQDHGRQSHRGRCIASRRWRRWMQRQGRGRIVNIASVAGLAPSGSSIAYAVSKAGLIHLTRCMAVALAPDVLVNCVAPGLLEGTRARRQIWRKRRSSTPPQPRCSRRRPTRTMSPTRWLRCAAPRR